MDAVAQYQPLEVTDFSGGRTDNYIAGPTNRYQLADNLLVEKYGSVGKLKLRFGSELYDSANPIVNVAAERIGAIRNFRTTTDDKLLNFSNRKLFKYSAGFTELTGPSSNSLFPSGTTTANVVSYAEWNDHIFITNNAFAPVSKVYNDGSGNLKLRTAGLPRLATSPTVTRGAAGTKNYIYRFLYKYTYTVNTVTFIDRGAITEVELTNAAAPDATAVSITAIPVLANGATYNWDTTAIKVEIYRSTNAGSTFYYVSEVTNGTTTYSDTTSDTTLQTHELLYTEGGIVENDPTPLAKLVHVTGDIAYYAHIKDGTEVLSNQLRQAIPGDPDSVPEDFFVNVQDEIIGLSSTKGQPILLCRNSVYRVDGQFDLTGNGGMIAQKINDTATCVSSQSVVQTVEGVFWAGEDSYYFTDGYQVVKLCKDWVTTYESRLTTAAQKRRVQGKYDKRNRRIWWTVQEDAGGSDECSACDVLHLDWGIKEDACFTSVSGGEEFAPTAIEFVDGDMLRGDRYGYLLIHSEGIAVDPKIDTGVTPADWVDKTIMWDLKTCAMNFGSSYRRKVSNLITATCRNESNLSLQITSINDDGRRVENLKPIRFRGNLVWGDATAIWGDPDTVWGFDGLIEDQRRFPSDSFRYSYKQLRFTNAFVDIVTSDVLGTVTVNSGLKTATLDNTSLAWPDGSVDYSIAFENDGYQKEFLITAISGDTVTFSDSPNLSVSRANSGFELRGYPKGEIFNLLSYTLPFLFMGQTQKFFTAAETGAVGT